MVGKILGDKPSIRTRQVESLVKLAKAHDLCELKIGDLCIKLYPKSPAPLDLDALAKKMADQRNVTDEEILLDPYAGLGGSNG